MNVAQIITAKRDGLELDDEEIQYLIQGYTQEKVQDGQMAAFAMAVYFQGMTHREIASLTKSMLQSGVTMTWPNGPPKVDKHSTGGIGDKISIPLAPILADCGLAVPMISGRGLGTTGGTIDKLEAIPGFRTNLELNEIRKVVDTVGCVITGASSQIAPADKRLYALRDVTGTVPSIPLITASILSKKLAEGLDALVMDVKWGNGAFMKTYADAKKLADSLVRTAGEMGVTTHALITDMNRPLGKMIGNTVEIDESIDTLKGNGPWDVVELTERLAAELFVMCRLAKDIAHGVRLVRESISSGRALKKFSEMVSAQGGDLNGPRHRAPVSTIKALRSGFVTSIDADRLGLAIIQMGGGRKVVGEKIDHAVGIEMCVDVGSQISKGEEMLRLFSPAPFFDEAEGLVRGAFVIGDERPAPIQLIGELIR